LVDKIANIEIQMSVLRDENECLKNKMAILNKLIKDLGGAQQNRILLGHTQLLLVLAFPHDPNPQLIPLPILQPAQVTRNKTLNL
jgi:hypothetical protein